MNRKERRRQKKKNIILGINANKFSSLDSDTIALNLKQAAMAISMENPKLALHIIDEILQAEHNHPDALNIKADLLLRSGETQGAIRLFIKIINVVPDFAQAHFNLGTALNSVGKTKRAIKSLQHALKIEPDYIDAHFNLANSWRQCGNTHAF